MANFNELDLSKILFSDIEQGMTVEGRYPLTSSVDFSTEIVDDCFLKMTLNAIENVVYVNGNISGFMDYSCGRCLKTFRQEIQNDIATESECDEDLFDLRSILEEEILSSAPITTLCDISCKGLCQKCGIDLNTHQCTCGGN